MAPPCPGRRRRPANSIVGLLGKAWFHTTEKRADGSPKYERVIIDAPATGHALTFLSGARAVAETVPKGPMKSVSREMADLIESKKDTCFHVVSLPEEMPVSEGLDFLAAARDRLGMHPGVGFMNRMRPRGLDDGDREAFCRIEANADEEILPYVESMRRRLRWEKWQDECLARFRAESGLPIVVLPELEQEQLGPSAIELLIDRLSAEETRA